MPISLRHLACLPADWLCSERLCFTFGFWGVVGYGAAAPYTEPPGRVIAGFVFMVCAAGLYVLGWLGGTRALSRTMQGQLEDYKAYCDGVANEYHDMMETLKQHRRDTGV